MRAVHITAHGGPEVLELVDLPDPEPGPGEVLIRVLGVSLNHLDLWVRRGMPGFPVAFPRIPGCDATGEIVALGEGVNGLSGGQKVVLEPGYNADLESAEVLRGEDHRAADYEIRGEHCNGFDAELVLLPARYLMPLPDGLDPVQAAAAPLVFLTAWGALMERAKLRAGETALILGAGSGVGSAGIQIAKHEGARVIATGGDERKRALALELGADEVVDHRDPNWGKQIRALTDGAGVDVIFEHIGPATWATSLKVLGRNGRLVTCGGTTGPKVDVILPHLFIKNQTLMGSTMGPRSALPTIFERLAAGTYKPVVDRVMGLSEVREAHQLLEDRAVVGKLVLVPGQ
ncbi:MAG: NADPH:quinone reductase-like Zn-dependent oxidoreductase [Planctomycetota bacterium]|jgi:NADPH:quinone reductase-like Zn-dependent oxidoreductase